MQSDPQPSRTTEFAERMLSAFALPGFRWLWASHHLYSTSLMMSRLALGWLVITLTNSPFLVGLAAGLDGIGKVGFGIFAGALVDRLNKRTLLMAGFLTNGVIALALGALLITGGLQLWHVFVAAILQGAADSLLASSSNTMLYQIVGRARVVNGSAAKMLSFNLARVTGSAIAGLVIDRWGLSVCYVTAGILACVAVAPALFIRGQFSATTAAEPLFRAIRDGLRYAWTHAPVRQLLTLSATVELFGFAHYTMVPVIARDVLGVGAAELGWLSSAAGLGALVGTLGVASLGDFKRKGSLLIAVTGAAGAALVVFAFSPWYALSLALSLFMGAALTTYDVLMHALFQLMTSDAVRGRVFSLYVLTFGFSQLGGFLAGSLANVAGAPVAVGLGGAIIVGYGVKALRRVREIRPTAETAASAGD
jgi:predicted MFS family arabinose efflux permease